ncbi:MAG: FCD domain-containing protein [Opitutales bacterium]|nr:FCD domain-containing protein [Opitutales bacterium]MBT5813108.1 FCD domain-containing protein [Opitutales bacterium]MBT6381482.1 FCD domain-containing protein [Opitutales bacterium]
MHPFREQDMLDYIDVRETLELKALKPARKRLDPTRLKEFLARNSPDLKGKPQLENSLHQYWIELSENRYIRSFFAQFGIYHSYLFSYSTVATSVIEEKATEHRRILRTLLKQDWDSASKALQKHIRSQRPNLTHLFDQLAKQKSSPGVQRK